MPEITNNILDNEIKRLQEILISSQKMADCAAGAIQECNNLKLFLDSPELQLNKEAKK